MTPCFTKLFKFFVNTVLSRMSTKETKENSKVVVEDYNFKVYKIDHVEANIKCTLPLPRSGHRIVCDSNNLYSFGGYNPNISTNENEISEDEEVWFESHPLFQELWRFNFVSRKWIRYSTRHSLPRELASNAVLRNGNTLMVYGGTGAPFGYRCSNKLYIMQLNSDENEMFEVRTAGVEPLPQYGQALVYHQGYMYTIGGTTGFDYTCDIHRLDLRSGCWEEVYICQGNGDYEPQGRYRHEVAFDGTCIYILGGGTADSAFGFSKIYFFNIETRRWWKKRTRRDPVGGTPPARRCHGAVQLAIENNINVFISGGYDGDTVFNDIWKLDLSTLQWTLIWHCTLTKSLYFHSTAVTPEGKMYIFGGIYSVEGSERSNEIQSVWVCIPKLSEICWEAILHFNPNIVNISKDKLINIGLPRSFVQRIE